jgi:hypothetical protein
VEEKYDVTQKKERKVFCGRPITVRMLMRNPLATEIKITKVRLVCSYVGDGAASDADYDAD